MEYVHWAEDAVITPAQTLYLDGCNLHCSFCQTAEERTRLPAARLTPELFREILAHGHNAGAVSVNILGGEPGVNLPALLELFAQVGDFANLVWNTNLYLEADACALLDGVVDIYLGDLKFGNAACAARLAGVADATDVAWERAREIHARSPGALIVRHLVLPGHFDCCTRPVMEGIAARFPGVPVSLKTVYMPPRGMDPDAPEKRFLSAPEAEAAFALARDLGLRLTADAVLSASRDAGGGIGGGGGEFEIAIAPDGGVYLRHALREAVDMVLAATGRE
jgi:putative pyruvate formate lyase activating enzyme